MRTGNLKARLAKLEQRRPDRGDAWQVTICYDPTDLASPDRLYAKAFEQLWARGYLENQHRLSVFYMPDNGRDPGVVPPVRVQRLNK